MFGLMRAKSCGQSDQQRLQRRLNYCGTCKTVGTLYGHKARLLLNHDTVFLAEILTALGGEDFNSWQRSLQSFNCLNLPKTDIPLALEFAATANLVLADFKLKDHIADENKSRWRFAHRSFAKSFEKAAEKLAEMEFPLEKLRTVLLEQNKIEANISGESPDDILNLLAEPTAQATALFFAHGAKIVGRETAQETMFRLGATFGRLIYLLDAFEDYEKDFRSGQFNAFRRAFESTQNTLSGALRRRAAEMIRFAENEMAERLAELAITEQLKELFVWRLNDNLTRKLKTNLPVLTKPLICSPKRRMPLAQRWKNAAKIAAELTANRWQYLPAFAVVALIAFIAPHEAAKAKSWQDCAGMGFNLMFLGALVGAVLAVPAQMAANLPPEITGRAARKAARKLQGAGNSSWCDSCSDCIDCGDCGCDSCDCCSSCCECGSCCDC